MDSKLSNLPALVVPGCGILYQDWKCSDRKCSDWKCSNFEIGNAQIGNVEIGNAQIGNIKLGNAEIGRMEWPFSATVLVCSISPSHFRVLLFYAV